MHVEPVYSNNDTELMLLLYPSLFIVGGAKLVTLRKKIVVVLQLSLVVIRAREARVSISYCCTTSLLHFERKGKEPRNRCV